MTLPATAQQSVGTDVIVGEMPDVANNAAEGPVDAFSVGTTSCNKGSVPLNWFTGGTDNRHPVIGQNLFRLHNGRFEQIGQAWLKHGFGAAQGSACTSGFGFPCTPTGGTTLGTGCSDPYGAGTNNSQNGLGPKWQVNAATGLFPYPFQSPAFSGTTPRRLRVRTADINPAVYPGARYFVEAQYVCGDDAAAGNRHNNASYREVQFSGGPSEYAISFVAGSTTRRERPGLQAWSDSDPTVTLVSTDVAGDGRFLLACRVTQAGANYTYEYALQNLNSHRCAGSFTVPIPERADVSALGFHDVEYHSGEPNALGASEPDSDNWAVTTTSSQVSWSGPAYAGTPPTYVMDPVVAFKVAAFSPGTGNDHTANVLRWGTVFNFRLTTPVAPALGIVQVGLWRPGIPAAFGVVVPTPGGATIGDSSGPCCIGTTCTQTTPSGCAGTFGTIGSTCMPDPCATGACCDANGICSTTTQSGCGGNAWTSGVVCSPSPCPTPTGSCCDPLGTCTIATQAACVNNYRGNGTTCAVACPIVPAHDQCNRSLLLVDGVPHTADNSGAGTDVTVTCAVTNGDLWYRYSTSENITVTVETLPGGTVPDTVVSVHTGACGSLTQIACDDDTGPELLSIATFTAMPEVTYFIRVASFGTPGTRGTITVRTTAGDPPPTGACCRLGGCTVSTQPACAGLYLGDATTCSLTACPVPINDRCDAAAVLCDGVSATGDNTAASTEVAVTCVNSGADLWYAYTPTIDGTVTVETLAGGSAADTVIAAFSGTCGGLTQIACDDDSGPGLFSLTTFAAAAGTTYHIRTASFGNPPASVGTILVRCTGAGGCDGPGACCEGTACSLISQTACVGTFRGRDTTCGAPGNPTACCPANFNLTGGVSVQDIFDFLGAYFTGSSSADFDQSGTVGLQDLLEFLSAYFTGCPG